MNDEQRNKAIAMFVAMLDELPEGSEPVCFYLAAAPSSAAVSHLVNLPTVDVSVLERSRGAVDLALRGACARAIVALIERQIGGNHASDGRFRVPLS